MKNFIASLQQDANNLVKEATELSNMHKEIWGLSGRDLDGLSGIDKPTENVYNVTVQDLIEDLGCDPRTLN